MMAKYNQIQVEKMKVLSSAGIFEIKEFIGISVWLANKFFRKKGWEMIDHNHDYRWAWVNTCLNKSIIAAVEIIDDISLGNEIITGIWFRDGIFNDQREMVTDEENKVRFKASKEEMEKLTV